MTDVSGVVCGVCIVGRWGAGWPYKSVGGCDAVMRCARLADSELRVRAFLLGVLERGCVKSVE